MDLPNTRLWRDDPRPDGKLPSDRRPDRIKRAVVLEAVTGKAGVRRKVGATANLDSSCARRLCNTAGRSEERDSKSNKETGMKEVENAVK
jgi:hypothetical protein